MFLDVMKVLAKRTQHLAMSKNVAIKIWPFSNLIQRIATYYYGMARRVQYVARDNVTRVCVEMLCAFGQALRIHSVNNAVNKQLKFEWANRLPFSSID